jgi:ATP-dependent Clp protease ATP-binding subunit ClpA
MRERIMRGGACNALYCLHHDHPATKDTAMTETFERFTEGARAVFSFAQEEAQRFNHNYLGTEHLLLGLIRDREGVSGRVLANLGVQLPKSRSMVELIIGRGDGLVEGDPGLTPRAKKVIELAMDEARRLNNHYIGTEHLLLGLVREGEGIAAGILQSFGVRLSTVRQTVIQIVSGSSSPTIDDEVSIDAAQNRERNTRRLWKMLLTLPDEEFERLTIIADERGASLADLIREALHRTWLTDEQNIDTPDRPAPPGDA